MCMRARDLMEQVCFIFTSKNKKKKKKSPNEVQLKKGDANTEAGKPKAASQPTNSTLKESFNLYIGGVTNKLLFNDRIRIQRAPLSYIHRSPYIHTLGDTRASTHARVFSRFVRSFVRGTIIVNFKSDKVHCTYRASRTRAIFAHVAKEIHTHASEWILHTHRHRFSMVISNSSKT